MPRILILALLAALALPSVAHAGAFPGEVIDGPSPDIVRFGDLDVSRNGNGAVVYVKRDGGVDHIFASRLVDGAWQPPERVDTAVTTASSDPVVGVAGDGRIVVTYVSGGSVIVHTRMPDATEWPGPQVLGPGTRPAVDVSLTGAAYVVWSAGGDIRAARLARTATSFNVIAGALDANAAQPAGDTAARAPRVAIAADTIGLVVWGERGADGRNHVFLRKLFDERPSTSVSDATLDELGGRPATEADFPDINVEDDSSFAWLAYRQTVDGIARAVARRFLGNSFDPPVIIDGMGVPADEPADPPALALSGRGLGIAAVGRSVSNAVFASPLEDDEFAKGAVRVDAITNTVDPSPMPTFAENLDGFIAWVQSGGAGDPVNIQGRIYDDETGFLPAGLLTNLSFGPVDPALGLKADGDRRNDVVVAAVQGGEADRRITAAMLDREPGTFQLFTTTNVRGAQPLKWGESLDIWGGVTYSVEIDGDVVGQTNAPQLAIPRSVDDGRHRWRVIATDRRGQTWATPRRLLRLDVTPPRVVLRLRRSGRTVHFVMRGGDVGRSLATGLARRRINFGDGSSRRISSSTAHTYRRGTYTVRATAIDRAGNRRSVTRRLRIP
jgi:hypothetical protein